MNERSTISLSWIHAPLAQVAIAAVAAFALIACLRLVGLLQGLEFVIYDLGLRVGMGVDQESRVVLVEETEADIQRLGYPLRDELLATVIERLRTAGARAIGVDKFRDLAVAPGTAALEKIQREFEEVVWIYQYGATPETYIAPPPQVPDERVGFNNMMADAGGIVRRGLLFLDDGNGVPRSSFPLLLALRFLDKEGIAAAADPDDADVIRIGQMSIPPLHRDDGSYVGADDRGYQFLLGYREAAERIPRITISEVLDGKFDSRLLSGRIVVIGSTADSLKDRYFTPLNRFSGAETRVSGVELHALSASQLVRGALGEYRPIAFYDERSEYAFMALACALGALARTARSGLGFLLIAIGGIVATGATWLFQAGEGIWFPAVPILLGFALAEAITLGLKAASEALERRFVMTLLERYVSPEVARELWVRRDELIAGVSLRPRRVVATVLFADVRGYSTVAEVLSPEETAKWVNRFLTVMAEAVMSNHGVVRQFVGDEIMAIFGAPIPSDDELGRQVDAQNALRCAVMMCAGMRDMGDGPVPGVGQPPAIRVGIHTGEMVSCSVGSERRIEYTVVGDSVNLAARLQALQPSDDYPMLKGHSRILVSSETVKRLGALAEFCRPQREFETKGRQTKVMVYEVDPVAAAEVMLTG